MKKTIFISVIILISAFQLQAQSKMKKVNKLLSIMQSEEMIDKTFNNMLNAMKQQTTQELPKEKQDEMLTFFINEMKLIVKKIIREDFPAIYDKHFTEKEIDQMIDFYKSPVGQKMLKVTPEIQKEMMTIMMQKYIPEFQQKVETKKKELKN